MYLRIFADDAEDAKSLLIKQAGELISSYSETLREKLKMDSNMRQALLDAALSGDMDGYTFWDPDIDTGQNNRQCDITPKQLIYR